MNYFPTVETEREQTIYRMLNQSRKMCVRVLIKEKQSLYNECIFGLQKISQTKEKKFKEN